MAEPSDLDWGADVGPDDDFRASGSEDADDWLQDAEEMKAPASATPTPAVLHSCSPPSAPLTNAPGDPTLSPLTPPSKPQTPEQLPSGPTTPQVYRQLKLDSPHRSRRGITPATPINPLFLEEEEAEEGAAGGDASCEEQQHHQCDGAAIPTQGSGIPEVSSSGVGLAASSTGEPAQRRQREDVLQSEQELGRKQHQQQQQSEHGNPKGTTGQVAQPLPLGKKQQQQQQQQPLQLSEADEQQQQLSQLSEANNQKQEPLQLSEAPDLSRQEVKQQQQQQHELLEPQGRNALSQASNGAEIQPEQGKLQEHQQQQQQQQQQKEEGVSAGAETQTAGVWSWAGAWGSKLKAAAEAAVAVAAPPPEPPHAEDSQGDAHEQQHQQHQQHQQLSEPAAPGEAPAAPAAPAVPATMHASKEPTAAARDPATRAAAAAAAALAARQKPAAAAKQQRQSEPAPSSAGEVDRTSKKQGDGSQQLPTHSPPHPVCAKRADKQPVGQQRQAQHKVDSNEGRKRNDGESGHEDDQEGSPTDEDLERGLQAIDEQMGRIGGALSSWWGGINRNTASIMSKVEEIVSSGTLQKAATSKVKGLERRIEAVGRNALHLLEDLTGQYNYNLGAMQAGGQDGEPQDFDSFFALYGGKQLCADLESLANECARICNRARSRLEGFQQEELDSTLAELGPIFSERLSSGGPGQQLSGVWGNNEECARASEQLEQRYAPISYLSQDSQKRAQGFLEKLLEAAHQVQKLQGMGGGGQKQLQLRLRVLEPNGKDGTEQQQQQFGKSQEAEEKQQQQQQQQAVKSRESCTAARQLSELEWGQHACVVATIELPEEVRKEKQTQGRICSENKEKKGGEEVQGSERLRISRPGSMDGEDCSAGLTSSGMDSTGSLLPAATQPASEREACAKVQELLFGLRVHATKRLAEVATAQLQLLLDHGASLSAPARYVGCVRWPLQLSCSCSWTLGPPCLRLQGVWVK
ncbi:hypothetical protein DUNSADRAFT_16963 [Dunaliella salina]|uniref:Uncharacterized protein n=1 Tax=Dunaliella salina TaxID=3046 RepID=A0ABQ7G2M9_DUNSA|nr:hypothetical protein DUNSADRAFT_16963 [Dunaliella salina]|eukprot:KAF5828861.1 hypothetical protein DUNSADRAFT_16963 [Dunaliella salina]